MRRLLEFVTPGVVHRLGNSLFAVRGAAHVLGAADQNHVRSRELLLEATERAQEALDLLRFLSSDGEDQPTSTCNVVLTRLFDVLRMPLRERGLRVEWTPSPDGDLRVVSAAGATRAVCEAAVTACESLGAGQTGGLIVSTRADAEDDVVFAFEVETAKAILPFPIDFARLGPEIEARLDSDMVEVVVAESDRLELRLPAAKVSVVT